MVKNINLFNYKNTSQFTQNKFFFDILFGFYLHGNNNNFIRVALATVRENSLMVKPQSSKLLI